MDPGVVSSSIGTFFWPGCSVAAMSGLPAEGRVALLTDPDACSQSVSC